MHDVAARFTRMLGGAHRPGTSPHPYTAAATPRRSVRLLTASVREAGRARDVSTYNVVFCVISCLVLDDIQQLPCVAS